MAYGDELNACPRDGAALVQGSVGALSQTALGPGDVRDTPLADPPAGVMLDPDPLTGRVLGGLYRVLEPIGRGGMGVVYLVEHVHLGKKFALKVLSRNVARNGSAVERLRKEAIAASRIEHENIVDIVSFDTTAQGDVFIVMEYLRGASLAQVLEGGPLPVARALGITMQIARALQAAHDLGIIHRDVKPENVIVSSRDGADVVKVLDFGISKVKDAENERVRMTKTGELVGTPLYMAPEQARGETELDARVDVYALGVILFEMLTGTTPFTGDNYFQLLWKHSHEQAPRMSRPALTVPDELELVVARALAKSPSDRFASMTALQEALAPLAAVAGVSLAGSTTGRLAVPTSRVAAPASGRRPVWVALGAAVLVGAGWLLLGQATPSTARSRRRAAPVAERTRPPGVEPAKVAAAVAAPPTPSAPALEKVAVALSSTPSGASVFRGDRPVGTTPTIDRVERSDGAIDYRFALRGHRDVVRRVVPSDDRAVEVRLAIRPRARGSEGGPPGVAGIKGSL